jgi:pyruvate dehydrogenase E1 component alpha subunit/2-oxoisovalerate dehydrogenase E1 component alpha subunit
MVQSVSEPRVSNDVSLMRESFVRAYRFMLLARVMDDKFASLYRAGKIHGGVFLGRGQEALSVSLGGALREGDVFAPLIRDQAGRLAFGEPIVDAVRTYLGSSLGPMRGRDGNIHRGNPRKGLLPMISHLGAMISVVNGTLLARRMKGVSGTVGGTSLGDGATSTGAFHEAINQAAIEKLPLVLIIADNQFAYSTPTSRQYACRTLADRAIGYGVPVREIDGTDLAECLESVGAAVAAARSGHGPQLVVARLLRLCGHGEHDDSSYIPPALKNSASNRDCLKAAEEKLLSAGWADATTLAEWREHALAEVEAAVSQVQREAAPDPFAENWKALSSARLLETHITPVNTTAGI